MRCMAISADLHTHTTCSDGVLHPRGLVGKAAGAGIRTLAITDHDSVDAWEQARPVAAERNIALIPGVELSVRYAGRELHLLGYFFDPVHPALKAFIEHSIMR